MLIFNGIVALAFYGFLLGTAWPANKNEPFAAALVGYWAKSLWISWLIVAISYWLNLPNILWPTIVGALAVHVWWSRRGRQVQLPTSLLPYIIALAVPLILVVVSVYSEIPPYSLIFDNWDALFSWNRWAAELAQNAFRPYSAAYPVLFPGLWSLIYKAQGDSSMWIVAKASMLIFPFVMTFAVTALFERQRILTAILFGSIALFFLWFKHGTELTSGYMDAPVAAMVLITAAMMIVSADADARPWAGHLTTVSILVGLSAITKQAGALLIVPFGALLISEFARGRTTGFGMGLQAVTAIVPPLTFLLIFRDSGQSPIGNLQYLQELAASRSADGNRYLGGLRTLTAMLPGWAYIILLALTALNFINIRCSAGVVGITLMITAIIGGVIFADCCSYSDRNGWWVVVLLAGSAASGLSVADQYTKRWQQPVVHHPSWILPSLSACAVFVVAAAALNFNDKARTVQADLLWTIGNPAVNEMVRNSIAYISSDTVIVSPYAYLLWLPIDGRRINACSSSGEDCVRGSIRTERTVFLVGGGTLAYNFLPLEQMQKKLLAEAPGYHLYGPFEPGELSIAGP